MYLRQALEGVENADAGPVFVDFCGGAAALGPIVPGEGGEARPGYREVRGALDVLRTAVEDEMEEYNATPGML